MQLLSPPPPLLTSLDEAKTATKSTPALTADVFQLSTPVAPQNRAGVRSSKIQSGKLITAALKEADHYLSELSTNLKNPDKEIAKPAFLKVRSLCLSLALADAESEGKFPLISVRGQQKTFSDIRHETLRPEKSEDVRVYAQEVLDQLGENPFLLRSIAVIKACKNLREAQDTKGKTSFYFSPVTKYGSQLEALQALKAEDFEGSGVPNPLDAYNQLFNPKILKRLL